MTLWLTLLLIWTTGIPLAVVLATALAVHLQDRRLARLVPVAAERPRVRTVRRPRERRPCTHHAPTQLRPRRRRVEDRRPA